MGFGLPQEPHHLRNPFEENLVYLVGGEQVNAFPRHSKKAIRDGQSAYIVNDSALTDFWS